MSEINLTERFPVDWTEWNKLWLAWKAEHRADLRPGKPGTFEGKNFLADDILGRWRINGEEVELSEVRMPEFGVRPRRDIRFVGITFGHDRGTPDDRGGLVETFGDLNDVLGLS